MFDSGNAKVKKILLRWVWRQKEIKISIFKKAMFGVLLIAFIMSRISALFYSPIAVFI